MGDHFLATGGNSSTIFPGNVNKEINDMNTLLVTGGAGFIGSHFVRHWLARHPHDRLINLDALTYAGNLRNLCDVEDNPCYRFVHGDICDPALLARLFAEEDIDRVVHFAAESHVDRSILGPGAFIRTNIEGTFALLETVRKRWGTDTDRRFLHVSTDEVYGSLEADAPPFTETHAYRPNSPYAASKAAADHLLRAYAETYGLPLLTTHCANNYGPFQFAEKLIPRVILNALAGKPLPVYGDGLNVRDWLYVEDHCRGIEAVLQEGRPGDAYNIGGGNEWRNIDIVRHICDRLDQLVPGPRPYHELITFVPDRPGHDRRYAIDAGKIRRELGWAPRHNFDSGLEATLRWYLRHRDEYT